MIFFLNSSAYQNTPEEFIQGGRV